MLWPGMVLRGLLQAALEKYQERLDRLGRTSSNKNRTVDRGEKTPSKKFAWSCGRMALIITTDVVI